MRKLEVSAWHTLVCCGLMGVRQNWWGFSNASLRRILSRHPQGNRSALSGVQHHHQTSVLQIQRHMFYLKGHFIFPNTFFIWSDQCMHQKTVLKPIFTARFKPHCNGIGTQALQQHQSWWQRHFRCCRQVCRAGSVDNVPFGQQSQRQV